MDLKWLVQSLILAVVALEAQNSSIRYTDRPEVKDEVPDQDSGQIDLAVGSRPSQKESEVESQNKTGVVLPPEVEVASSGRGKQNTLYGKDEKKTTDAPTTEMPRTWKKTKGQKAPVAANKVSKEDPCLDNKCFNNGTCLSEDPYGRGFSCACPHPTGGKLCQFADPCVDIPCPEDYPRCMPSSSYERGRFCYDKNWKVLEFD